MGYLFMTLLYLVIVAIVVLTSSITMSRDLWLVLAFGFVLWLSGFSMGEVWEAGKRPKERFKTLAELLREDRIRHR